MPCQAVRAGTEDDNLHLDAFTPWRDSIIWKFNRLFWQWLSEWEAASGRGFEAALPSGSSDANHPQAVAASVTEFWKLLQDLDGRGQLPAEIVALEIGVGSGARAAAWLDGFKALDEQSGSGYYKRLRFFLGDYSTATLDRALKAVAAHTSNVSVVAMDALNPFKTLSSHRFKVMYVHLTNVYDNLPFDELVRRDGRLYLVEARGYVNGAAADRMAADFGMTRSEIPGVVQRMFEVGPSAAGDGDKGVAFWRCLWGYFRLEERLRALDDRRRGARPAGPDAARISTICWPRRPTTSASTSRAAPPRASPTPCRSCTLAGIFRCRTSSSSSMDEYRQGFKGPGKLDGSLVAWVNGALLRAVGARAGYDVHFAPFPYRPGSKTSILYTTQRP